MCVYIYTFWDEIIIAKLNACVCIFQLWSKYLKMYFSNSKKKNSIGYSLQKFDCSTNF